MQKKIDSLLASDIKAQSFLKWIHDKANSINESYESAALRAFYFSTDHTLNVGEFLSIEAPIRFMLINSTLTYSPYPSIQGIVGLFHVNFDISPYLVLDHSLSFALKLASKNYLGGISFVGYFPFQFKFNRKLRKALEELWKQIPNETNNIKVFREW